MVILRVINSDFIVSIERSQFKKKIAMLLQLARRRAIVAIHPSPAFLFLESICLVCR